MAITFSEIPVGFHGKGAGSGELTWGQMGIWRATQRNRRNMNLIWPMPLPDGTPLAEVVAMLRFLVSRHPALRTRLRFVDGPSGNRHPRQLVAESGDVPLHIADIGDGDDPAVATEELRSRYELNWFDYENEFPVRMGVVRQSGTLKQLVVCYSHVMLDGGGLDALDEDLPAMELAMRAVGARTGADGTAVLLAAYSAAVAQVFGRDPSVAQIVVSNRFRPGLADMVSQVSQHGICVVDAADASFHEVVARAQKAVTSASFYAYYDPVACDTVVDEMAARRGQPLDISWCVNDRRGRLEPADGDVPTEAEVTRVLPRTKLYWDRTVARSDATLFLHVDTQPLQPGRHALDEGMRAIYMKVWADLQYFSPDQLEALIREMEAVVVRAAFDSRAMASRR